MSAPDAADIARERGCRALLHLPRMAVSRAEIEGWDPLIDLNQPLAVPPWPSDASPGWLRRWSQEVATNIQVPVDMPAMHGLGALAVAAGGKVSIDAGWTEAHAGLFIAAEGAPGVRKSAVLRKAFVPIKRTEAALAKEMNQVLAESAALHEAAQQRLKNAISQAAKAPEGDKRTEAEARLSEAIAELERHQPEPVPRLFCGDATQEALATLIAKHHGRMAVVTAEATPFEIMTGRYCKGANLDIFLCGYTGDTIRIDRRGRSEQVDSPSLSIVMCLQRQVLSDLREARAMAGRGLLGRFLYSMPPSCMGARQIRVPPISSQVESEYGTIIERCARWHYGVQDRVPLTLSPGAREAVHTFLEKHEPRLCPERGDLADIVEWASKLHGGLVHIAGLIHIAELARQDKLHSFPETVISEEVMRQVLELAPYFIDHARAALGVVEAAALFDEARTYAHWLAARGPRIRWRDIQQRLKRKDVRVSHLRMVFSILEERNYIRQNKDRRFEVWEVHPDLMERSGS